LQMVTIAHDAAKRAHAAAGCAPLS
jgi:hypothetical protein